MSNHYLRVGFILLILPISIALRTGDVLTDVGVTMADVRTGTLHCLRHEGLLSFTPSSAIRAAAARIPPGSRAATVQLLGKVVRSYVESDAFRHDYQQSLQGPSPDGDSREAQQADADETLNAELLAIQQAYTHLDPAVLYSGITTQLPQMEAELATLQGDDRRLMQQHITETSRMLSDYAGKPAEFKKQYLAYQLQQLRQSARPSANDAATGRAKAASSAARRRIPKAQPDVRPVLRKQLTAFVALCNDVDFRAKLVADGARQEFANPAYRAKSATWKLLFRMGKEPVMAARAFAQAWLADLH
ncbi:hypothetical protein FAES_3402 [Fibrella aestuarina BUZ 2]|uniref:Uncharacterized protein n=1 Tax=Fibrella aestuarina BUZ 2 TaxID=1166018 RepID=I0KBA7_9BACT|nr:hypothetical protein [Fibrella aestuarina]CCH01410.1 hypothetical protein FAES_3402 [Fibrella aestuarina BUZ 2]